MKIAPCLDKKPAKDDLEANSIQEFLTKPATQVEPLRPQLQLNNSRTLHARIEREILGSTKIGNGDTMPHARLSELKEMVALFARCQTPAPFDAAPFDAIDRRPILLIFGLLVPAGSHGIPLKAFARVSRLFKDDSIHQGLSSSYSPKRTLRISPT
ncbi:MAG: PTS sugar transporter subunit IIA [Myxococcota bacterium]|nr:PTS sugar transporter subunit IIA [Myxococcota bacterium]